MKEASGELSMTLVTIIAIGVIVGVFYALYPKIRDAINARWGNFEQDPGNPNSSMIIVK